MSSALKAKLPSRPVQVAAGVLAALAADVAFDPVHRHVPLCPFHSLTGWWCPLCGGLRCADALAHGQWATAVHDNVALVAALPLLAWWWLDGLHRIRAGRPRRAMSRPAMVVTVCVLIAFTVARNLPGFAALRP